MPSSSARRTPTWRPRQRVIVPADAGPAVAVPRLPRGGSAPCGSAADPARSGSGSAEPSWAGESARGDRRPGTVSSPSRHRERPPATGHPAARRPSTAAIQRCTGPKTASAALRAPRRGRAAGAARAPARPGTLRWISAFGSRSATIRRRSRSASRSEIVKRARPVRRPTSTHERDAAELVAGAVDQQPAGRQARAHPSPRGRHLGLVVLPQHVDRADDDRPPAAVERHLEPAEPRSVSPGALRAAARPRRGPGRSRGRRPRRPAAPRRSRSRSSSAVTGAGAVAEVDDQRVGRRAAAARAAAGDPPVDAAQPVRARGAARDRPTGSTMRRQPGRRSSPGGSAR